MLYFSLMSWFAFSCWCRGQLLDSCHKTEIEQVKQNIWPGWRSSGWHTLKSRDFVQLFWREKKLLEILCLPGWWKLSKDGHKYGKSCSHFRGQREETIRCLGWQETHTPNRNVFYLLWVYSLGWDPMSLRPWFQITSLYSVCVQLFSSHRSNLL